LGGRHTFAANINGDLQALKEALASEWLVCQGQSDTLEDEAAALEFSTLDV
jgi:hypothetical protein